MELGDFIGTNAKIREILMESGKFLAFFAKTRFSQNHAITDFFIENEARKLKFGTYMY